MAYRRPTRINSQYDEVSIRATLLVPRECKSEGESEWPQAPDRMDMIEANPSSAGWPSALAREEQRMHAQGVARQPLLAARGG